MQKEIEEDPPDDNTASLVAYFLTPLYNIIYSITKEYIIISRQLWAILSFIVLLLIMAITQTSIRLMISLLVIAAILEWLASNKKLFRVFLPSHSQRIVTSFLRQIGSKKIGEVLSFIKGYTDLTTNELIKIVDSKHKSSAELFDHIVVFQTITPELIRHIVDKKYLEKFHPDLLRRYIGWSKAGMSNETINKLMGDSSARVRGATFLSNPQSQFSLRGIKIVLTPLLLLSRFLYNALHSHIVMILVWLVLSTTAFVLSVPLRNFLTKSIIFLGDIPSNVDFAIIVILLAILLWFLFALLVSPYIVIVISSFWGWVMTSQKEVVNRRTFKV